MISTPMDPETVRRYLLGEATEAEAGEIEASFFARDDLAEEVAAAEQDLIEDYLEKRLEAGRRKRFEAHYLASPAHRRRVAIIRELRGRVASRRLRVPPARMALAAAAAAIVIVAVGSWLVRPPSTSGRLVAITLPSVLVRGGSETPTVHIGPEAVDVELRLEPGGRQAPPPLQVTVRRLGGEEVWRGPATTAPDDILSVTLPADRLPDGDYFVFLTAGADGGQELHRYFFRATRP